MDELEIQDRIDAVLKKYRPLLTFKEQKLDLRARVAYGPRHSYKYVISVYMLVIPKGAGTRGGDITKAARTDVFMLRTTVPVTTSELEQLSIVQNLLEVVSIRMNCDYAQRLRCDPKPQRSEAWIARQERQRERELTQARALTAGEYIEVMGHAEEIMLQIARAQRKMNTQLTELKTKEK